MEMKHKEKPIYLYHAVLLISRRAEIGLELTAAIDRHSDGLDVAKLYGDHIVGGKNANRRLCIGLTYEEDEMEWPNAMRILPRSARILETKTKNFLHPEYREIYLLLKKELDLHRSRGRHTTMIPNNLEIFMPKNWGFELKSCPKQTMAKVDDAPHAQKRNIRLQKGCPFSRRFGFQRPIQT